VDRSERETFFGFTLYAKALTKDIFADSSYLGRYCFLLADNSDSIQWTDIKSVLNLRVEGAGMPELDPLIQPIPFQMDGTSMPIVSKSLFETIDNQKVVNYSLVSGEDHNYGVLSVCNYGSSVTILLVVNGVEKGNMWTDYRAYDEGICPSCEEAFGNSTRILCVFEFKRAKGLYEPTHCYGFRGSRSREIHCSNEYPFRAYAQLSEWQWQSQYLYR
jgi:hypothetical protein